MQGDIATKDDKIPETRRSGNWSFDKVNRSRPLTGLRRVVAHVPIVLFLTYAIETNLGWLDAKTWPLVLFFSLMAALITYYLFSGIWWRSFTHLPPAPGRIMAIVPVYNEESHFVHEVVKALLRQTILPNVIHVIDDGSQVPLETFEHPLVHWHRTKNQGKRHAQATALKLYDPDEFDFILTVDSDSVLDHDALERMLESMSEPKVMASTGMIYTRNWRTNIITRMTDMNVTVSCLLLRMARSWLGIVSPTSGALALYRSHIVYDNLDDYLTSGTAGDDRRLSFYALLEGQVVGVTEAVVSTQLPTTIRGAFWQRMRWSKSAWLGTPFVLTNMRPLMVFFYTFPLVFALMFPFSLTVLTVITIRYGSYALLYGVMFWVVTSISNALVYVIYRPAMSLGDKLIQVVLSIFYPLFGLIILRPAAYWALTQLKSTSWHTRGPQAIPGPVAAVVAAKEAAPSNLEKVS
jgi:cellulose synthase/poly-beta-1,6-N-acetylglucosamine synthase-like glycosyltransferase